VIRPRSINRFFFEIISWDLARVSELYRYHYNTFHGIEWGIKGHNRPWIIERGDWEPGMRFLDIGAGYSDLPAYLVNTFDLEGWVADDFGATSGEKMWSRWGDPRDLPKRYPDVKYVFKNIGMQSDEFPENYFDRVYSVSVLEHISPNSINSVLNHMALLLKPGGIMLHTMDIPFPRTINAPSLMQVAFFLARVFARRFLILVGAPGYKPYVYSVEGWAALLRRAFNLKGRLGGISTFQMVLDHDVLVEPPKVVYCLYPPKDEPKPYWRSCSLTFILRKIDELN
jgi:SAM-dependent methyltransferase